MSLTEMLAARKARNAKNIPAEKWTIMERSTNDLKVAAPGVKAVKAGDILPEFNLPDVNGDRVSLGNFTSDFLVVSFYRGGWCPFCNLELKALQGILPQLEAFNTALVAISPETPDYSLSTAEKNELTFTVLSDVNNTYARSLGLVFQLPADLQEVYHGFNLKVDQHNGNQDYELPMPATYVINQQREIIFSFIPEDYTERLDPDHILEIIAKQTCEVL